jgi:hypothetical protein
MSGFLRIENLTEKQYLGQARIALNQPDPDYYDKIKGSFVKK